MRLLGDIHGNKSELWKLVQTQSDHNLTIQLGDFGIGFGSESFLGFLDSDRVKILAGNHDNYSLLSECPHNLGRYGILETEEGTIFYICGAYSIDATKRTPGFNWWPTEELTYSEMSDCYELFKKEQSRIDIILSHDCPDSIKNQISRSFQSSSTSDFLEEIFKLKSPRLWRFGHYHVNFQRNFLGTNFKCLNINEEEII